MTASLVRRRPAAPLGSPGNRRTCTARRLALVLACALVTGSCSSGGGLKLRSTTTRPTTTHPHSTASTDTATASDTGGGASTDTANVARQKLKWTRCDGDFQCATLKVPLDYATPEGKRITLGLARQRAKDPSRRIGSLLVNPGGPGASAVDFMEAASFPAELTQRFDLVGVDPRGVGRSTAVNCHEKPATLYAPDPTMEDQADVDHYLQVGQDYVAKCQADNGVLLRHVGSRDTARDMDEVRKALGDKKLTFAGFSYGTVLGATYAGLFPDKVRAIVIDGVVDTSKSGIDGARFQADGFELALSHFFVDCQSQGASCPAGPDPSAVLDRVTARAEASPIPSATSVRPAGPGELNLALGQAMYSKELWPKLAQALADADRGDGGGLVQLANDYLRVANGDEEGTQFDGYFAIGCVDQAWPRDPAGVLAAAKQAAVTAPHFGEALMNDYVRCAQWPAPSDPITPPKAVGSPPILVVGTTGDPATPYQASVDMAKRLPKGVLLTFEGEGHVAFGTSQCVTEAETQYLVTLRPPPERTRCTN